MTQRQTDENTIAALDQVRALLDAESSYVRGIPLGDIPDRERRMVADLRFRIQAAREQSDAIMARLMRRLDPYDDAYTFQPAEPIEITANGIIPKTSGFCNYQDRVTVQDVPADTIAVLLNHRHEINETQKPSDVTSFYGPNEVICVGEGDAVAIRVQATITPTDEADVASRVFFGLSIMPTLPNMIFPASFSLNGFGAPITVGYSTTAYAGETWARNGAKVMVRADGPIRITSRTLLVTRLHKSRL